MPTNDLAAFVWENILERRYEVAFIVAAIAFELIVRSHAATRLFSKSYGLDLIYAAFYRLGVFTVLLDRPLRTILYDNLTFQMFAEAPIWVRVAAYLIALDFANYWVHRIEHWSPSLWAFHQVHHSQEHLTIMATYRNHPIDTWLRSFVGPVLFMFFFGIPPAVWLPMAILWDVNLNLSHLDVNWRYGPLRWLLVSPVFHSIHHSVEERHQNRNFGMTLSIWDHLFGTADNTPDRPAAVGLPGWTVRESFVAHCVAPFRGIARHYRGLPMDDLAPLTPDEGARAAPSDDPARSSVVRTAPND